MKKIIALAVILISIISFVIPSFAFELNEVNLYKAGDCSNLLKYNGIVRKISYVVYNKDGIEYPAYCLNIDLPGAEEGSYNVSTLEKLNNNEVWKTIINGYPYRTLEELGAKTVYEAYAATKQAVYLALYNRNIDDYSGVDSEEGRRTYEVFKKIVNDAKSCDLNEPGSLNLYLEPLSASWKVDGTDNKCVSKKYKIHSNVKSGDCEVNIIGSIPNSTKIVDENGKDKTSFKIGDTFKIMIPIKNLEQTSKFKITVASKLKSYPVLYGKSYNSQTQNYAITGLMYENKSTEYEEEYFKNETKIIISKQEYGSKNPLQGVEFQLLNSEKNVINDKLITDGDGCVKLKNLEPGKYFIREIKTLDGYNLYTDDIEINLDLNEEIKIIVYNTKKKVEVINKNFENIEVVSDKEESVIVENIENTSINNFEITRKEEIIEKNNFDLKSEENIKKLPRTGM